MPAVLRNACSWETLAGCLHLILMGSSLKELWPEAFLVSKSVAEWFLYKPRRWNFMVSQSLTNFWNGDSSLSGWCRMLGLQIGPCLSRSFVAILVGIVKASSWQHLGCSWILPADALQREHILIYFFCARQTRARQK